MTAARIASTAGAPVFGWDVGGAHVKVSRADSSGVPRDVAQWACPLWQGLDHLERAVDHVFERWPEARAAAVQHVITMTGEMVDLFPDRAAGVRALSGALAARLGPRTRFFAGVDGWLDAAACGDRWRAVASANWLATAQWLATRVPDALLVDIGSTTTDIIPVVGGRVVAQGANDAARLVSGELVYQGVVRTPLCGIAHRIVFRDQTTNVMNEWFATSADVYRLTGELWPAHDQHPSADNGPKTEAASRMRLARMIGFDAADATETEWRRFAQRWRHEQLAILATNLSRVRIAHPALAGAPIVGAGCGRFLAAALARHDGRDYIDFAVLAGVTPSSADLADVTDVTDLAEWVATCAPGVAVALLAGTDTRTGTGTEAPRLHETPM